MSIYNKYKGHIMASLAVVVAFLLFGIVGALLDLKHAGGLIVQVPFYMLVVALWGYVYNYFKQTDKSFNNVNGVSGEADNRLHANVDNSKYLNISVILNMLFAALLVVSILKIIGLQKHIENDERVPGYYDIFAPDGRKGDIDVVNLNYALSQGAVLIEQSRRINYDKRRRKDR